MIHRHGTIECCPLVNGYQSRKDAARALVTTSFKFFEAVVRLGLKRLGNSTSISHPPPFLSLTSLFQSLLLVSSLPLAPLQVGPLNAANGSSSPSRVWGAAGAEIEFGAF